MYFKGDPCDPADKRMQKVYDFKPFGDYIKSWVPEGCTNPDYVIAQYDAAVTYMDCCIQQILTRLKELNLEEDTIVIFVSDHGETLYDHDCYFDHHGMYDCTLVVPLILRWKGHLPEGKRYDDYCQLKDVTPTLLELMGIENNLPMEGRSLLPLVRGEHRDAEPEFYITECTWMRKHGWRTPEWKLIVALEPDFHFKPELELYNLIKDPEENHNVAAENPEVVEALKTRMYAWIAKREKETGRPAPIYTNFLNGTAEAFALVKRLQSPGLAVNLDLSTILANGERLRDFVDDIAYVSHVHISEPGLVPIQKRPEHAELAMLLKAVGYRGYVSIEMGKTDRDTVCRTMDYIAEVFA